MQTVSLSRHCWRTLVLLSAPLFLIALLLSVAENALARNGHHDHHQQPSRRPSIGIRIRIPMPSIEVPEPSFEVDVPDIPDDPPAPKKVARVRLSKMSAPRMPHLHELITGISAKLIRTTLTNPKKSLSFYELALSQSKRMRNNLMEIEAYANLGHVYYVLGWFPKGIEHYSSALQLSRKIGNREAEADAFRNLSATYIASGSLNEAEKFSQDALELFSGEKHAVKQQMIFNNLGVIEKNRGRFSEAQQFFDKALKATGKTGDFHIDVLTNMGKLMRKWGVYSKALDLFSEALDEAKKTSNATKQVNILLNMSKVFARQGKYTRAIVRAKEALDVANETGEPVDWPNKVVGDLYLDSDKLKEAEPFIKKAGYDSSLGRLYLKKNQFSRAKTHYEQLLKSSRKVGNLEELFTAHTGLAKIYEARKNYNQARSHFQQALKISEDIRSSLLPAERKNFYLGRINGFFRSEPAKGLVRVALKQNKGAQSIYPSEVTRARDFADSLSLKFSSHGFDVPSEILESEADVSNRVASLNTVLRILPEKAHSGRYKSIQNQINKAQKEQHALVSKLWEKYRHYASVRYPKPVRLSQATIGPKEYVVFFDVLGEGVGTRLIKTNRVLKTKFTRWKLEELDRDIQEYRKSFETAEFDKFDTRLAAKLHQKLFGDLLRDVPERTPIIIIPDGILALLPFESLVVSGKPQWKKADWGSYPEGLSYLGDRHPIIYYQSLTALTLNRGRNSKGAKGERLLVIADPVFTMLDARSQEAVNKVTVAGQQTQKSFRLMAAIEEESSGFFKLPRLAETEELANSLQNMYGSTCEVHTGMKSSKANFMKNIVPRLNEYKSMIFATHGFAGNEIPGIMEPALALTMVPAGTDGFLTMSEVAGLKMSSDIAALTACKTGVGVRLAGEGVMSMGRAFQCAGAKSVLISLWSVAEDATVKLTEAFFRELKHGKSKLEALEAARSGIKKAGYSHPFFWSSFILVGEGGNIPTRLASVQPPSRKDPSLVDKDIKLFKAMLFMASKTGDSSSVKMVLERGLDVDETDENGKTALMHACSSNRLKVVECLLNEGANVNMQDHHGWTPLMLAADKGETSLVKLLIKNGAQTDYQNQDGETAAIRAAKKGHTAVARILGAKPSTPAKRITNQTQERSARESVQNAPASPVPAPVSQDKDFTSQIGKETQEEQETFVDELGGFNKR